MCDGRLTSRPQSSAHLQPVKDTTVPCSGGSEADLPAKPCYQRAAAFIVLDEFKDHDQFLLTVVPDHLGHKLILRDAVAWDVDERQ